MCQILCYLFHYDAQIDRILECGIYPLMWLLCAFEMTLLSLIQG